MTDREQLKEAERQAKTMIEAAAILDEMLDAQNSMVASEVFSDDEGADDMWARMETAKDACQSISVAMTLALFQEGYIPDFGDDGDDRDTISSTFH